MLARPILVTTGLATLLCALPSEARADGFGGLAAPADPTAIVGGTEVPLGRWDSVVGITFGTVICTGTLIAPRIVLTAAHCLDGATQAQVGALDVRFGTSVLDPVQIASADRFGVFPEYCPECTRDRFDLGYVRLVEEASLPDGFPQPITDQAEWDQLMNDGQLLTMVGFGQDEDGIPTGNNTKGSGIKREVDAPLEPFSGSGLDFRAGGDGRDTCNGDSGGPAFVTTPGGQARIAGVLSAGFGGCGEGGLFMVPLPALAWIAEDSGQAINLPQCGDETCIDTSVDDGGCGCRSDAGPGMSWLSLMLVAFARRRRAVR